MRHIDITNVQEAGSSKRLPAGPYICRIISAEDFDEKEYLKITYDIAQGDYAGYYGELRENHPEWKWVGAYVKSYKTTALPMFKRFCSAVSKSNGNYVFDGGAVNADENSLKGRLIGLTFREEEYYSNSGDLKTRLIVDREFPVAELEKQKTPPVKKVSAPAQAPGSTSEFMELPAGDEEELPF